MRNLKRVLALAMAMVMILGMMVIGSSAASYSDSAAIDEDYAVAVEVLTGMGVFRGTGAGFAPKQVLDRASAATLIYRVITGDVKDQKVELYDYPSFDDTVEGAWYNGYVTYAANGKYIVGDGTGKFNPNAQVTGVQVLKIMLRAMGYGANGEFEGAAWSDNVLTVADDLDLLENVKGNDLNLPATRELVAQLLFDAIQAPTTNYTPAFGYNTPWGDETSIAVNVFKLAETEDQDKWGRPAYVYYGEFDGKEGINPKKDVVYATFKEDAVATYSVKVSECQIAKDMGLKKNVDFKADGFAKIDVYTNGKYTKEQIDVYEEKADLGAQGRLIEVYSDRLVVIDTWLAQVTDVNPEKVDKNGHVKTEACTDLDVWFDFNDPIADTIPGNDYAEDEYLLVNYNKEYDFYEVVGTPDTFVGAQSKIWVNKDMHTIDGEDYMDAVNFNMNDAGRSTANFTWFFDQYGNLIGAAEIVPEYEYAVLKDIIWVKGEGAEATIVYMDGTEDTVSVSKMDGGWEYVWNITDRPAYLDDDASSYAWAGVSTESRYNTEYQGAALFKVEYNKDGSVNLHGYQNGIAVYYADNAAIDPANLRLTDVDVFDNFSDDIFVTTKTEFLVREGNARTGYTYETYTINTIPNYEWNTEIFFTGKYNESIGYFVADRVYIKNAVEEIEYGTHIYVPMNVQYGVLAGYDTFTWEVDVYVDGVMRTIATGVEEMETLVANQGKLMHVDWYTGDTELWSKGFVGGLYGFVADVHLVNEKMDGKVSESKVCNCDYLAHGAAVLDTAILCGGVSYMTNDATEYVGAADLAGVNAAIKAGKGVWVVYKWDAATRAHVATTVYVGTKLSDSAALKVNGVTVTGTTYTVTIAEDDADGKINVSFAGVNANTLLDIDGTIYEGSKTFTDVADGTEYTVTVYAEDGCAHATTYTVKVEQAAATTAGLIKNLIDATNTETVVYNGDGTCYATLTDAVANVKVIEEGTAADVQLMLTTSDVTAVAYRNFTSTADIVVAEINVDIISTGVISLANPGEYIAVVITDADGADWYAVFQVK